MDLNPRNQFSNIYLEHVLHFERYTKILDSHPNSATTSPFLILNSAYGGACRAEGEAWLKHGQFDRERVAAK